MPNRRFVTALLLVPFLLLSPNIAHCEPSAPSQATGISASTADIIAKAKALSDAGKYEEAESILLRALKYTNTKDTKPINEILVQLYRVWSINLINRGMAKDALPICEKLINIDNKLKDDSGKISDFGNIGIVYYELANYKKAIESYKMAIALVQKTSNKPSEGRWFGNIGIVYLDLAQYDKALEYFRKALSLAQQTEDKMNIGAWLGNIGNVYICLTQYDKALEYYLKALTLAQQIGNKTNEMSWLGNIGLVYTDLGQYDKALKYDLQALTLAEQIGDKLNEGKFSGNIGLVYTDLGQYDKALEYYNKALAIAKEIGDKASEATWLHNIGLVYIDLAQYGKAQKYFEKTLALAQEIGDQRAKEYALGNIGIVYYKIAQYDKALEYYTKALTLAKQIGGRRSELSWLGNIGIIYYDNTQYDIALNYDEKALTIAREIGDKSDEEKLYNSIGNIYYSLGQYNKTLEYYQKSLFIIHEIHDKSTEATTLGNLMLYYQKMSKPSLAIFYGKQAVNVKQSIRTDIRNMDNSLQKSYLDANKNTYRTLADLLVQAGRIPESEQVMDLLKEDEFHQLVRRSGVEINTDSPTLARRGLGGGSDHEALPYTLLESKGNDLLNTAGDNLLKAGLRHEELLKLKNSSKATWTSEQEKELVETGKVESAAKSAFQNALARINTLFAKAPSDEATNIKNMGAMQTGVLADINKKCPGSIALYSLIGEKTLYIFAASPQIPIVEKIKIDPKQFNKDVTDFRYALMNPSLDPRPLGKKLYDLILGPIDSKLQSYHTITIVFSLDGVLRYIPIGALYDGKQYVAERYCTVAVTSASQGFLLKDRHDHPHILAAGVSLEHPGFIALPAVPDELRSVASDTISSVNGAIPGEILLDKSFTKDALNEALQKNVSDTPEFPLVHLATHFDLNAATIDESGLLLGDGSLLKIAELATSAEGFTNVDLVTLSACNTAIGASSVSKTNDNAAATSGAEVDGIGMLMQKRGASSVLASLWSVEDNSTSLLMGDFYKRYASGEAKGDALRHAQLDLIHGVITGKVDQAAKDARSVRLMPMDKKYYADAREYHTDPKAPYAHPYYWAPFILIGNWK